MSVACPWAKHARWVIRSGRAPWSFQWLAHVQGMLDESRDKTCMHVRACARDEASRDMKETYAGILRGIDLTPTDQADGLVLLSRLQLIRRTRHVWRCLRPVLGPAIRARPATATALLGPDQSLQGPEGSKKSLIQASCPDERLLCIAFR